ncbi:MAG: DUF998 domain-containing protein [Liquorilactobacillus ghanensis]|uniref:DUF998 domain-containing protein n=1 Tax=Liquorilactobacillus ghanensis TaxID=399370 RepID=UPI0039E9A74C
MKFLKKYGFLFLLVALLREINLPFFMGFFSETSKHVWLLSELGQPGMPLRNAFKIWEIIDGILFILAAPYLANRFKQYSRKMAITFGWLIALYGIGDCLMTALFDYSTNYFTDPAAFLHAFGSFIGSGALLLINFSLLLLAKKNQQPKIMLSIILLMLCSVIAGSLVELKIFAWPLINGILQCVMLDTLYLPLLVIAAKDTFLWISGFFAKNNSH